MTLNDKLTTFGLQVDYSGKLYCRPSALTYQTKASVESHHSQAFC